MLGVLCMLIKEKEARVKVEMSAKELEDVMRKAEGTDLRMCVRGMVSTCHLPEELAASERQVKRQADRIRELEKRDEKPVKTEADSDVLRRVLEVARECIDDAEEAYADAPSREISAYLCAASTYLEMALAAMKK